VVVLGTSTFVCQDVEVLTNSTLTCSTPAGTGTEWLFVCVRRLPSLSRVASHRICLGLVMLASSCWQAWTFR
jgi:hypothetical protein